MKKFANKIFVKCANMDEKKVCANMLELIGYTRFQAFQDLQYGNYLSINVDNEGKYLTTAGVIFPDWFSIDHFNYDLVRDIVSVCSNETWQMDEPKVNCNNVYSYLGITGNNGMHLHGIFVSESTNSVRRPTVAEICNHYGYHLEGNNIVKNVSVPTLEELDAKIENLSAKLYDAIGAIKPCCEPNPWKWFTTNGDRINVGDQVFYVDSDFTIGHFVHMAGNSDSSNWTFRFTSLSRKDCEEYFRKNRPFEPVDVVITCNSPEELRGLWHTLNISQTKAQEKAENGTYIGDFFIDTYKWWRDVDKIIDDLNLNLDTKK